MKREKGLLFLFILGLCFTLFIGQARAQNTTGNITGTEDTTESCIPQWACLQWSECDANQTQHRECSDLHNCNSLRGMPELSASCGASAETEDNSSNTLSVVDIILITAGVAILLVLVFFLLAKKLRKNKKGTGQGTTSSQSSQPKTPPTQSPPKDTSSIPQLKEESHEEKPVPVSVQVDNKPLPVSVSKEPSSQKTGELQSVLR